ALGRDAGDGRDQDGGDFARDVLPAGDAGPLSHAEGTGSCGQRGGSGDEPGASDRRPGSEGQGAGEGGSEVAAAAADDASGDRVEGEENRLDEDWKRSFAELETEDETGGSSFEPDAGWRERALSWERKLSGSDEVSHGEEDLHRPAGGASGAGGAVRDGDGGDGGDLDGER